MIRRNGNRSKRLSRHRVSQEDIDAMAELRRHGVALAEVGARRGLSERTARRYVGKVEPKLNLPAPRIEPGRDPAILREQLIEALLDAVYRDRRLNSLTLTKRISSPGNEDWIYGGPPSILFLNECEKLLRERLNGMEPIALRLLAKDPRSKGRFLREVLGYLYQDYVFHHEFAHKFLETGEDWRPPGERPSKVVEEDDL